MFVPLLRYYMFVVLRITNYYTYIYEKKLIIRGNEPVCHGGIGSDQSERPCGGDVLPW